MSINLKSIVVALSAAALSIAYAQEIKPDDVAAVLRRPADWGLNNRAETDLKKWTIAPFYDGLLRTADVTGDASYMAAVLRFGNSARWAPNSRTYHADDHAVGLVVSWDVFDPGRFFRLGEARASELAAAASHEQVLADAELEIESAYQRYLSAGKRVVVGEKAVDQSRESMRIVHDRYNEGLTTITEVLRAQAAAAQARYSYLGALFDHHSGYADLLRASGTLTSVERLTTDDPTSTRNDNEPTE